MFTVQNKDKYYDNVDKLFLAYRRKINWSKKMKHWLVRRCGAIRNLYNETIDRFTIGFPKKEAWSPRGYIAQYALPRIRFMRSNLCGFPPELTYKKWGKILDKIIFALDAVARDDDDNTIAENPKKVDEGLNLLGEYFLDLWD